MTDPTELLTTAETCRRLGGLDRSTVSRWVQLGRLTPAVKLPGRTGLFLFHPDEVERVRVGLQAVDEEK